MPLHGVESGKQTHFVRGIAALFYEGRWRLTTVGRGRPPALIRLARRSPNPKSDQRASHLLSRTREGTLKELQNKPTPMPLHGVESGKQTHFVRGIAALFYEGRWRFTTVGRGRPPALIRLARRSPNPKSDQRASHLLSRTREGTLKELQKQTHSNAVIWG